MKKLYIVAICLLSLSLPARTQHIVSLDLASIRNTTRSMNGLNVSSFYYLNKRLPVGLEVNRFFPVSHRAEEGDMKVSAWDIELNMHYLFSLYKGLQVYPITGIGHASDKEINEKTGHSQYKSFWSWNTGAGISWLQGKWNPHIEYNFAWGQHNQQFLLAGLSYELEWGHQHKEK